jgi:peroxiredoxin Q/BCP
VGKKILVVYFYPADMTGGCTAQACGYRDHRGELADRDVEVIGVSGDTVDSHQLFKKAHGLNFTLLADVDGSVAKKFGVPISEGERTVKKTISDVEHILTRNVTAKRWTFVIDRDGKIAYKDDQVKAKQDPEKILSVVAKLR